MHRLFGPVSGSFAALLAAPVVMAQPAPAARAAPATSPALKGQKRIILHTRDGQAIPVGTVVFIPTATGSRFDVQIAPERTTTYFLSMRNFRCVEGDEVFCHVPYPYPLGETVAPGRLDWLEHALLFLSKSPKEFGARFENGIYFRMEIDGSRIVGTPQGIDLEDIGSPPDDPTIPPYSRIDRFDEPEGDNWIARLTIE